LRGYDLPTIGKLVGMKKESVGCFITNIKNRFGVKHRSELAEAVRMKDFEVRDKRERMHDGKMKRRIKWEKPSVKSKTTASECNNSDTGTQLRFGTRLVCS
jgi:hypothetical protein